MTLEEEDEIVDRLIAQDHRLASELMQAARQSGLTLDDMLHRARQQYFRKHNNIVELILLVYGDEFE